MSSNFREMGRTKPTSIMASTNKKQKLEIKIGSINIDGMSSRSRFMLDRYSDSESFDILAVQESRNTDDDKISICNMDVITDDNHAKNSGVLLYTSDKHSITKLKEISQISTNIDTTWGITVIKNKRFVIGSVYLKHNYINGIQDLINMLNKAKDIKSKLKASGIIVIGDLNARHTLWGDKIIDKYGKKLTELLDMSSFSILSANSPTFMAVNGSSCIDLMIISNNLIENVENINTDEDAHLYSGAPERGHVPLIAKFNFEIDNKKKTVVEKINTGNICWEKWSNDLEKTLEKTNITQESLSNPKTLGQIIDEAIEYITLKYATKKKSTNYSKPYWTAQLTRLCNSMREARKKFRKRNTQNNKENYLATKETFDEARKLECQNFLIQRTSKLNSVQSLRFWKEFNLIFKKKKLQKIDPLFDSKGNFLTDTEDMEELLFATFFEGHHLHDGDFDEHFFNVTNKLYEEIINNTSSENDYADYGEINSEISIAEIKSAIKNYQTSGKSADRKNFNPIMFKHLGPKAIEYICKLANLCLKEGTWIWDKAEVIFLKKSGKDTYSKPGSYRPISISDYIGKLIEKILAARIYKFLISHNILDPNQEGFIPKRNTIRYLNRLINGIKSDIQKKLTTICIFIDFEKAFDSIWKAGLIVKLHQLGITGNFLRLINDFLVNRKVTINVNGVIGPVRQSSDVGLPQGSALSPILFRIYLLDILQDLDNNNSIELFKFADDGTIKVTGYSSPECLQNLNKVIKSVENWVKKNRMIINCQPDKTEIMCFSTAEGNKSMIPKTFKLCGQDIKLVKNTKALGLIIDDELTFIDHGNSVYKKLVKKWAIICNYSHRHWGFNQQVMIQIIRTLFHSSLFYAGFIWINKNSIQEIMKLHYQIMKTTIGAVFNISTTLAHIILGIPPIDILNTSNLIKHYLKLMLNDTPEDKLKEFLIKQVENEEYESVLNHSIRQIMNFLRWKITAYPDSVQEHEKAKILSRDPKEFVNLNPNSCKYTRAMMNKYIEHLWMKSVQNEYLLKGQNISPYPKLQPLPIKKGTSRKTEVTIMSFFYENNLMNQFLYRYNPTKFITPLCDCGEEEQTAHHILFRCKLVEDDLRHRSYKCLQQAVGVESAVIDSTVVLVNASREPAFMESVKQITCSVQHRLKSDIII